MNEIKIEKLSPELRDDIISCVNDDSSLLRKLTLEHFMWQYEINPAGSIKGFGAYLDGKIVAVYIVSPVRFIVQNEIVTGAQSMSTLTLPIAQGRGLFKKLAKMTYSDIYENSSIKLVYGFPNSNSVHGFTKHLNWTLLDPVPYLVRVLDTSYIFEKLKLSHGISIKIPPIPTVRLYQRIKINRIKDLPEDIEGLWLKFRKNVKIGIVRDEKYLRWRFENRPSTAYYFIEARNFTNELKGIAVLRVAEKYGGRIAYIMELMADGNEKSVYSELIKESIRMAHEHEAEIMVTWAIESDSNYRSLRSQFFFPLPRKLWPIELHFGFTTYDKNLQTFMSDRLNWHLSYSDSDTV